jgi:hypothetical protein
VCSVNLSEVTLISLRRQGIVFPSESSCRFDPERSVVLRCYGGGRMILQSDWERVASIGLPFLRQSRKPGARRIRTQS